MKNSKKLNIAKIDEGIDSIFGIDNKHITTSKTETNSGYEWGTYEYENDPMFGNPTTHQNEVFVDTQREIMGFFIDNDSPTPDQIINGFTTETTSINISEPEYTPAATHDIYEEMGHMKPVKFSEQQRSYGDSPDNIDPEEIAKRKVRNTNKRLDEVLIANIVDQHIEDEYYIEQMKLQIDTLPRSVRFYAPCIIVGCPQNITATQTQNIIECVTPLLD